MTIDPKDVRVGDLVRERNGYAMYWVREVYADSVLTVGVGHISISEIAEVVRPAEPRPNRKIKRSELIAWFYAQSLASAWRTTDGGVGVSCAVSGNIFGPTIYAAILELRAELRKKGKLT